jgi:NADH-quinone oxidoreductase subunit M
VFATSGVIFAAVYLLWMYQRVAFGTVTNPAMQNLKDLTKREMLVLAPIFIFIIWIGIYPGTFLKVSEESSRSVVNKVMINYQQNVADKNAD